MKNIAFYKQNISQNWYLQKSDYSAAEEENDETLFTLSNGYMGIRGSLELENASVGAATFIAGLFDKKEKRPQGVLPRGVTLNKAITPAYAIIPDCNFIQIESDGLGFDFINCKILHFERTLDLKRGLLFNEYTLENEEGKILSLRTMAMLSKVRTHLAMYKVEVTPVNFGGALTVVLQNSLCLYPQTIRRLKDYVCKTELLSVAEQEGRCVLRAKVSETGDEIALFSKSIGEGKRFVRNRKNGIDEIFKIEAIQNQSYTYLKTAEYFTSHDELNAPVLTDLEEDTLIEEHIACLAKYWAISDVDIEGDCEVQLGIRWNIFNLIQLGNEWDSNVSISATGLHGQGYFGHAFWDTEIFIIPFYLATNPTVARQLLLYRYHRLDEAREIARTENCIGAKFPWTSAYTGADVTPPDWATSSQREIHIAGAVAYAMYNYYQQTQDKEFFVRYGVETLVETAKYYASRAILGVDGFYHLEDVTGPDEYNIRVKDNYYTNYLAVWNIRKALLSMQELEKENPTEFARLCNITVFNENTVTLLKDVSQRMAFPSVRNGVVEQFDGFFALKDTGGFARDENGMPLDRTRIFDSGLQELKQPDVVMLHYLFPDDFSCEEQKACFTYYEKRCKHGSSLSPSIHCVAGLRNGFEEHAYAYLSLTALMDLKNLHMDKNLYEGIHIACSAGAWSATVYGFGGLQIKGTQVHINPRIPKQWSKLSYKFLNGGVLFSVVASKGEFSITANADATVFVQNEQYALTAGNQRVFRI